MFRCASMDLLVDGTTGTIPKHGAIFMSNRNTLKECLRRRLFGLPFSWADFVKHVKVGMILFLFEHERRELHGVFQASTDGAIDIVPNAFCSSGKQFSAQVYGCMIYCSFQFVLVVYYCMSVSDLCKCFSHSLVLLLRISFWFRCSFSIG